MSITLAVKPLSVNQAWQGKRYKTTLYKNYEEALSYLLPKKLDIPEGELMISFEFGFSNKASDVDNPVKPLLDILQKKYGFNDSRVYQIIAHKNIVPKGKEYVRFEIKGF